MANPLVSVLVTNYNKGDWLADCLWSAFSQTYKPVEVVLCENGSTDQSLDIINSFVGTPGFVPLIYKEKLGITKACNVCIEKASGEWIAFLDADDIIAPTHIENLIRDASQNPGADMIYGDIAIWEPPNKVTVADANISEIFDKCQVALFSAIIKKSVFDDIGKFDELMDYSQEWEYMIRMIKAGKKLVRGSQTGYIHRIIDPDNASYKKFYRTSPDRIRNHRYMREKHQIPGPCQCGCDATVMGSVKIVITPEMVSGEIKENQTISVGMIVKNEEKIIEKSLKSSMGADEVVILDTGSTDKTGEVVANFRKSTTADLKYIAGEYVWNDNFAEARNECYKRCTGDWILGLDADEYLEEGGIQKIRDLIKTLPNNIVGVGFKTIAEGNRLQHESVRLIRNNRGVKWHGAVHNYLSVRAQYSSNIIVYYGYSPAHSDDPDRAFRILTKEVEKDPTGLRNRFYLAREYYYRKRWEEAVEHYKIYLEKATWHPEVAEAWMQVSRCYNNVGMNFEARLACLRALEVNADFKDALKWMAALSQDPDAKKKWEEYATLAKNTGTLFCSME